MELRSNGRRLARFGSMPVVVLALLLLHFPTRAATTNDFRLNFPPFFHRIWQFEDGLQSPNVRALKQTEEGYLLLATDEGLAQFDGLRFRDIERKTMPGKAQRWFVGLIERKDGSIWASAVDGGIFREAGGVVTRYTTNNSTLANNYVLSIFEDSKTNLWIGTASGLSVFTNGTFLNFTNQPGLIVEATRAIIEDQHGHIWIGTAAGLSRFDGNQFTSFTTNDFLLHNAIYCLEKDRNGGLWIGTFGGMTYLLDGKAQHYTDKEGLAHNSVRVLHEDSQGQLWIGTQGGLQILANESIQSLKLQSVSDPDFRINSVIYSIIEDREANIWVGTSLGLNQLRSQPVAVYSKKEGLPSEVLTAMCQETNGTIWIGTYGGLCRFKDNRLTTFTTQDGLPSDHILSLFVDKDNSLWIGTDGAGLSHLSKGKFKNYSSNAPKANVIRVVMKDHRNRLWLGSNAGADRFKNGKWERPVALPVNTVKAIVQDAENTYWFAGDDGLVKLIEPQVTHLREKLGFSPHTANSVQLGREGDLYVGTDDGFFYFLNGAFHHITAHPELQRRRIFQIVEDDAGNIWLATQTGILCIPKAELRTHVVDTKTTFSLSSFGKPEGMRRAQCNAIGNPAVCKMQDGRIWFATMNGVAVIEPGFQRNTNPPPVAIEEIIVDGTPAKLAPSVDLPPGDGNIELVYTALSLQSPEKVRFHYKLEGIDAGWVDAGTRRVARYSNIKPGKYRFIVRAANNDGIWNTVGSSIQFTLQKHFYQTFWFTGLCVAAIGSLIALVVVGRVRATRHREAELQREIARHTEKLQNSLKTMESFNYSIAHDLRGPLRAIKGLTEALHEDYSSAFDEKGRDYSRRVANAVDRMDSLIADLLAFGSISHKTVVCTSIDLDALLRKAVTECKAEMTDKNAVIDVSPHLGTAWANEVLLQQILLNLISNGLKFIAPGVQPQLRIWTKQSGQKTTIYVRDNGIGIAKEHHQRIFGVFERLHATGTYPGTGIGLAIVVKAAERMDGVVGLDSEPGKGSCFWIELPARKPTFSSSTRE